MAEEPTAAEVQLKVRQLLGQATLLRARGEHREGLAVAQQAAALDGESWEAQELVGDFLLALERPEQALASYRRARELNPDRARLEDRIARAALAQAAKERTAELSRALLEGKKPLDAQKRNPSHAAVLSLLIPGLGQVYNREAAKGLVIVIAYVVLFALTGMAIQSQMPPIADPGMGAVQGPQAGLSALVGAAFTGPALLLVIALVGLWIYAIADAALRAGKTMTSDDTGVV